MRRGHRRPVLTSYRPTLLSFQAGQTGCGIHNPRKPLPELFPVICATAGFVGAYLDRAAYDGTDLFQGVHVASREGLHHYVAQGRGLDRAGEDRKPRRVGGELAEEGVLGTAAHDVNGPDALSGYLPGLL